MMPEKKINQLRRLMAAEDWRGAVRLAATFSRLGDEKKTITRAWEAYVRPEFQRGIGRDTGALIVDGIAALKRRYR
jgi:hypothetical protein